MATIKIQILFFILATEIFSSAIAYPVHSDIPAVSCMAKSDGRVFYGNDSWDHYIFVQQYPAGACSVEKPGRCSYPANANSWTIHGLWPTLGDTKGPGYCNKSEIFNVSLIKNLIPRLRLEWTNLLTDSDADSFWCHEWCKHGSCTDFSEYAFFETILDYYEQDGMEFGDILEKGGVLPSDDKNYPLDDILDAFHQKFGVYPYSVSCMESEGTGPVLTQIGICLDKSNRKVTACPSPTITSECSKHSVHYPTSKGGH